MATRKCPKCRDPLIAVEYGQVEIDCCPICGGIWLDGGELEALAGLPVPPSAQGEAALGLPDRDCPVCVAKLAKERYGHTDVVVDKCPHGDGIWLDQGELPMILAACEPGRSEAASHDGQAAGALRQFFSHPAGKPKPPDAGSAQQEAR
jgi:Zn-finger nucleic acid-binding protein